MNKPSKHAGANLRQPRPGIANRLSNILMHHLHCLISSLGALTKTPLATLLTSAALGIALALPAGLYELLLTIQETGGELNKINKVTLYLQQSTDSKQVEQLIQQLSQLNEIITIEHIDKSGALEEFKKHSGFGDALKALKDNPLPHVLIIEPQSFYTNPENTEQLLTKLRQYPMVETAQLDVQWLKRLFSIIEVGKTSILVISSLLAIAVLLIIGNTIRLSIENKRQEILIVKLIGGTNSFIRRPFLYTGIWYGLFGGIIAIILIDASILIINQPLSELNSLYQSDLLNLSATSISHKLQILIISAMLGLLGSIIAVNRQLKQIELR